MDDSKVCKVCWGTRPIYCSGCMGKQMSIRQALENLVSALGRRSATTSELLSPEQQMGEIGDAMRALRTPTESERHKGDE